MRLLVLIALALTGCGGPASPTPPPARIDQALADEFAGRFPDEVAGVEFPLRVAYGDDLPGGTEAFLEPLDVGLEDVLVANGGSPQIGGGSVTVSAWRVLGVSAEDLTRRAVEVVWLGQPDPTTEVVVAGKRVRTAGDGTYLYGAGDTVYVVTGDEEPAIELLGALP